MRETLARPARSADAPAAVPAPAWGAAARASAPPVAREALAETSAPLPAALGEAMGHHFARVRVSPAEGEGAERQARETARRAEDAPSPASESDREALGQLRVHTGPRAAAAARALGARAFSVGPHLVFGAGEHAPGTASGRALLAHEVAHAAQAHAAGPAGAPLRRDVVHDPSTGLATGYEFRVGVELREPFARRAHRLVADGALGDNDIRALVKEATDGQGTVNDHERMFMAGLRDAANVAAFQGVRVRAGAAVTFPVGTIRASYAHVVDVDRAATLPAGVAAPQAAMSAAVGRLDVGEALKQGVAAESAAAAEIVKRAGPLRRLASALTAYVRSSGLSAVGVLEAMQAAASDNTPSDQVLAGCVFAVAQAAGHAVAADVRAGRVRVDAVSPRALARLPGFAGMRAAYVTVAQGSGAKGDTVYLPTDFDVASISERSTLIHELDHAAADRASSATGRATTPNRVGLELRAYRTQARYILTEMQRQGAAERTRTAASVAGDQTALFYGALLLEAQTGVAAFRPLAELLFTAAPAPLTRTPAQFAAMLRIPVARVQALVEADIATAYGITATDTGVTDGLAGESIVHWIDRI